MSADQTVRLVFLGEAGAALRATDTVTSSITKLSSAQKQQAATSRVVTAETGRTAAGMRTLERDIGRTSRGALAGSGIFRGLGRSIAFASASFLGGYGLLAVVTSSVGVLKEASANAAETEQRLRATGHAAGVTASQIDVLARATLRKTGYDVEAAHAAENLLLTFTQVRNEQGRGNDIYTRAVKLTADLARAMNEDLSSAAMQLGRALNDPVRGLTTLSRAGIQFSAAQREQIKALTESGQILEAQKIILDQVAGKVGGVAAAYGDTAAGKIDKFRGEIRLLEADFATALLPDLVKLVDAADRWARKLEDNKSAQATFRRDVEGIATAVSEAAHALQRIVGAVGGWQNALELLIGLKVAEAIAGWTQALALMIGSEAAGTGVAGAAGATGKLNSRLERLRLLTSKPFEFLVAYEIVRKITGSNADLSNNAGGPGDLLPVYRGGKWVDPTTGDPVADQAYWNRYFKKTHPGVKGKPATGQSAGGESRYRGAGVAVPTSFTPTHQTAGLAGFPAVDIMAKPGTRVLAPEDGAITRVDGHEPSEAPPQGQGGPWGLSLYYVGHKTGNTYYMTHLMKVGQPGEYRKGDVIGLVGDYPGSSADHVHVGIHQGSAVAAYQPSSNLAAGDFDLSGGKGGGSSPSRRPGRGSGSGGQGPNSIPLNLQEALARAGTTKSAADDRSALRAIIAWLQHRIGQGGLPQTTRIDLLNQEGSYLSQLDALNPKAKKTGAASKSSLLVIKNTLAEVSKLVDQAGLSKKFGGELGKINDLLDKKLVTSETVTRIRIQLGKISDAAKTALENAKKQVEQRKQAFTDAWSKLASDALAAFDKETADHVGPSRALLNTLIAAHDKAQIDQAVVDAKKALDDALKGQNAESDSEILSRVREMVGKAALANAIDKAQSQVLGINPAGIDTGGLLAQLQQALMPGVGGPDQQAVADAQKALNEALYQQKVYYLGLQADAEDTAYADERAKLRDALDKSLTQWGIYYAKIGLGATDAAAAFKATWDAVLSQFPAWAGGTGGGGGGGGGGGDAGSGGGQQAGSRLGPGGSLIAFAEGGDRLALSPTLILAGEKGPERVSVRPVSQSGMAYAGGDGGSVEHTMLHLSLGDPLDRLVESKVMQLTPRISVAIGAEATMRARSGRF